MKKQHKLQPSNNKRHLISLFSFLLLLFLFTSSCQDEEIYLIDSPDSSFNIEDAKNWFEANNSPIMEFNPTEPNNANNKFDAKNKKQILLQNDWKHAFKTKRGHLEVVEVALKSKGFFGFAGSSSSEKLKQTNNYGYLRSISRLIIIKNKKDNSIKSAIMTIMGSTNYLEKNNFKYGSNTYLKKEKDFEGMVFFNTLKGDFINGWEIKKGKVTGKLTKKTALSKDYALKGESEECHWEVITHSYFEQTSWYTMVESGNGDNIYISYHETPWEFVEETGEPYEVCETTYTEDGDDVDPDLGDGGGGGQITLESPDFPIANIQDFLNCFQSNQNATLTIYVNQPINNDDAAWSISGVGHAFIGISQGNVTRIYGFYPDGYATPINPNDPSRFGNDQGEEFDVSVRINLSPSQLSDIIIESQIAIDYNLNTYNCTDFVMAIAELTDLPPIPDTQGSWPGGSGNNPGALGEDLRIVMANLPGVTLNPNGGNAPQNNGTCN